MAQDLLTKVSKIVGTKPIFISTLLLCLFYYQKKKRQSNKSLPPLAPGYIRVIGHLASALKQVPLHETFTKWSKEVGPIYTCYFGSQKWIVLNDQDSVKDLIVDRGNIYSSRNLPEHYIEGIFQGERGGVFALIKYGNAWRKLRRIAHNGLIKNKINDYQPILDERRTALLSLLYDLSQSESNIKEGSSLHQLIEYSAMTIILSIAFGNMCSFEVGNPTLHRAFQLSEQGTKALSPADQLREFFPILNTIWPVKYSKYLKLRRETYGYYGELLKDFKSKYEKDPDSVEDCFMKEVMNNKELTDLEITGMATTFVGAGSETTKTTTEWVIALLANHPDVQEKAFKEIEQVVGLNRLPSADDEPNLPYVQSIILETLRLKPPAPLSLPHSNIADDVYKSWVIPKDTIIMMNIFNINMDEKRFPDPYKFNPDRYMNNVEQKKTFSQSLEDRPHLTFSTGRRVCVGIHLAERSIFMTISMLLATFKFERISDELIDTEIPRDIYNAVYTPKKYKVRLVPRHDHIPEFLNKL